MTLKVTTESDKIYIENVPLVLVKFQEKYLDKNHLSRSVKYHVKLIIKTFLPTSKIWHITL